MEMQTENRLTDPGGVRAREGEGGTNGESSVGAHTPPCIKQTASANLLCDSGKPDGGSVTTWRWDGGRGAQEGGDPGTPTADVWKRPTRHCNAIILRLKISKLKTE